MKVETISQKDKGRIHSIFQRVDNKEAFLYAIVESLVISFEQKNAQEFKETLESWEASAEIDNIPGAKDRIWKTFKQYKTNKKINRDWGKFKRQIGII